jgi:DNA-binding CsgD family transcriptional regulator/tetratricopeptide (TPR) repeat protein
VTGAARDGWATLAIRASSGFGAVPLGPFRTVLRISNVNGLTELSESVANELLSMRSAKGLVVLVDDCQDLDEASAGLLHQLVVARMIVAVMTTRSGGQPPAVLTCLWTEGVAERVELQNLSLRETSELLAAALGGMVQDSSARRMWRITGGNPLYLREVVHSSHETGALRQVDGEWCWRGEWAKGDRLQEIVASRLGRLDPDELTAMEMLAVAKSLPLSLLAALATARAVEQLETRALVTTERSGRRVEIAIAHPLHAEVLRTTMPALRQRSIRRNLVDALCATGTRRSADRVRLACWSLESGVEVDAITLSLGADAALFTISPTIAARLGEILPDAPVALPATGPAIGQDVELAVRLAEAAYDRTGSVVEGVALASTLAWTGAIGRAEAVLAELAGKAAAVDDRLRLALALGFVRFWGRYRVEEACAGLLEAADATEDDCDPRLLATVYEQLAGIAVQTARPALALEYAQRASQVQGVDLHQSVAAPPAAAALSYLGHGGEALTLIEQALPAARESGHPLALSNLLFSRAGALARMGDLEQARGLAEWLRDLALSEGLPDSTASYGVLLGAILLRQGRPATAGRLFQDAAGLLAERDVFGYRPWALAGLARAKAQIGEEKSAAAALEEACCAQPTSRHFDMTRYMAQIELHSLAGRRAAAVQTASEAVAWARTADMVDDEAQALDAWVRLAPLPAQAKRLAELATMTDSKLVALFAEHACALVDADAPSLLDVSERFAALTAWGMATEAAAAAARTLDRRHKVRAAQAAARTAARYGAHCEGMPPLITGPGGPTRLTKRELETAAQFAAGNSTKEIAARMYLSPRTVENHLYHAYIKLGVTDRDQLATALESAQSPSSR